MMERGNRVASSNGSQWAHLSEGDRIFDFRLQFQASRVPKSGWDKLVVSLISAETGKTILKTSRALVRNGSCQWPHLVVESVIIPQDPASGDFAQKLYNLVVQMGSLRSGILGEATINLADYIDSDSPDIISLPLKRCTAGTVLHVRIQCLTPKVSPSEQERDGNSSLEDIEDLDSASENDSELDSSEDMLGSVRKSATIEVRNGPPYTSISQRQFKAKRELPPVNTGQIDGPLSVSTSPPRSFDSSYDSTPNNRTRKVSSSQEYRAPTASIHRRLNSTASQESGRSVESFRSSFTSNYNGEAVNLSTRGWQDAYSWQAECLNPNLPMSPSSISGSRSVSSLSQKLDSAQATIRQLREEATTWERHAHKLNVEAETLRQQLAAELKNGAELRIRVSSLESENNILRSEIGQQRGPDKWEEKEDEDDYIKLELENTKRLVSVLQEEVSYGKEVMASLQVQLEKTQESNNELVVVVTELEEALEVRNREMSSLVEANHELREQLHKASDGSLVQSMEGAPLSRTLKPDQEGGFKTERGPGEVIEMLTKVVEEQSIDCNELTDENIELLGKLRKANMELEANMKLIAELEASLEGLSKAEASRLVKQLSGNMLAAEKQEFIDQLQRQVRELEHKNKVLEQQVQQAPLVLSSNSGVILQGGNDIDNCMANKEAMDAQGINLSNPGTTSKRSSPVENDSLHLRRKFRKKLRQERGEVIDQSEQYSSSLHEDRQGHAALEKKLTADVRECSLDANRLGQELAERMACEKLQVELAQAKKQMAMQEMELQEFMEYKGQSQLRREELELLLEKERAQMQEKFDEAQEESRVARERLDELVGQMAALTTTLDSQLIAKRSLERRATELQSDKEELETQVMALEDANVQLSERLVAMEAQLTRIHEERDACKEECVALQKTCVQLEAEIAKRMREACMQEEEIRAEMATMCGEKDSLEQDVRQLEREMRQLQGESAAAMAVLQSDHQRLSEALFIEKEASIEASLEIKNMRSTLDQLVHAKTTLDSSLRAAGEEVARLEREKTDDAHEKTMLDSYLQAAHEEIARLQLEKSDDAEKITRMVAEVGELKQQKVALEGKLSYPKTRLEAPLEAGKTHELEHRNELLRLKRYVSQVQRRLVDHEEGKLEYQRRVDSLEEQLLHKTEALFRAEKQLKDMETVATGGVSGRSLERVNSRGGVSFSLRDSKEVYELRQKLKCLEEHLKLEEDGFASFKEEVLERENELYDRIEQLELSNEQLAAAGPVDPATEQLTRELIRLQTQNSLLSRKEQELKACTRTQQVLKEEVIRLQEINELLEDRLMELMESSNDSLLLEKFDCFLLERMVSLETELSAAMEANNMYKLQFQRDFNEEENDVKIEELLEELDQTKLELAHFKARSVELEDELREMSERYTRVNLELAEAEVKRGELMLALRNGKRT